MKKVERVEYKALKNEYYSLKEKVIDNISKGYCIIPEKTLIELRDKYNTKLVNLLEKNSEVEAKEKLKSEYDSLAQKYYLNNISKEFKEQSRNEINELEQVLSIYETGFESFGFKEGLLKILGKTKLSKIITGLQLLNGMLCFIESDNIAKNLAEIVLMQYSKYELDKNFYKKSNENVSIDNKMLALKEGIDYLEKYFERKGIMVMN
ncbi:MAG: hypothetical protein PHN56_03535 [Candidatus Nanoarchaeia archaeon]|nr:hypothetical protein [Candidatus Nanoarchaeia archaeon]